MGKRERDSVDHFSGAEPTTAVDTAAPGKAFKAGELLVQFVPGTDVSARAAALGAVGGQVSEIVRGHAPGHAGEGLLARITLGHGVGVEQAIEILSRRPGVGFAEPNWIYTVQATSNDPAYSGGQLWGMYGDRTSPANQYGSQAGEAWAAGHTGSSKVVVGVIDSGIDHMHPDLYLNVWLNPGEISSGLRGSLVDIDGNGFINFRDLNATENKAYVSDLNANGRIDAGDLLADTRWENGTDDDANGYVDDLIGWDFVNNDNDPYDDNDHGTHVSGTIAGAGGNGVGVAGVTWSTQLVGLKFLSGTGSGSSAGAIKAVDYFTAAAGAATAQDFAATNNSWGGGGFSQALLDSIVRGAKRDILFVAAAGNGGSDGVGDNNDGAPHYPSNYDTRALAGYDAVISVASITSAGALSSFSNFGPAAVDLGAPGSSIYSTLPGGGYGAFSGTSMATPHVAGAIALYSSLSGQAAADIKANLFGSTIATASLGGKTVTGGRLDVEGFIGKIGAPPPPSPTINDIYGTTASDTVTGTTGGDRIWGVPATGTHTGRGTLDTLVGNGGADTFVLGDARGRFYDDGVSRTAGTGDYALVRGFNADDKVQVAGPVSQYIQTQTTLNGVSGVGLYFDGNANGRLDSRDELIGLFADVASIAPTQFVVA